MHYPPERDNIFDRETAEKILSERLENVTESIQPSLGYELRLEGVQTPNPLVWGALETYFDTLLDIKDGARLTLAYDPLSDGLALQELAIDTVGTSGPVSIRRTKDGYIPIQTVDQAEIVYSQGEIHLMGQKNSSIKPGFGDKILESFGISTVPHLDSAQYQLWLSSVLGNTRAWRLTESSEIPLVLTESATQSIVLKKEVIVGESADDFFVTRSLSENVAYADPLGNGTLVSESKLELSGDIGHSNLKYFLSGFHRTPDLVIVDEFTTDKHYESVTPIGEAEYSRLKKKLEEVALLKYRLTQLD